MATGTEGLLPANINLLQPGTPYYRLTDVLQLTTTSTAQMQQLQGDIASLQGRMATAESNITTLQSQVVSLQNQINTINTRLANAGIP